MLNNQKSDNNYLKNAEVSTEQNYNQIDGIINNEGQKEADLTDGQTFAELLELAPETLPQTDKPSILGQLKEAKELFSNADGMIERKRTDLDL